MALEPFTLNFSKSHQPSTMLTASGRISPPQLEVTTSALKPVVPTSTAPIASRRAQRSGVPWPDSFKNAPSVHTHIPSPESTVLPTYYADGQKTPYEWGVELQTIVDRHFGPGTAGMALVRGLPTATATDFAQLMAGCGAGRWQKAPFEPFGGPRTSVDGIELATNLPKSMFIMCHNEMSFNPRPCDFIVLGCSVVAERGGESVMARNADYSLHVSPALQEFVKVRGGLRYTRYYRDGTPGPVDNLGWVLPSWQSRCGLDASCTDRDAAAAEFLRRLGPEVKLEWDSAGGVAVHNVMSGFNEDGDWCNSLRTLALSGLAAAADGAPVPAELLEGLTEAEARAYRALQLDPGDVWLLDNMRAAHGRLPYEDGGDSERTLFTYLANQGGE